MKHTKGKWEVGKNSFGEIIIGVKDEAEHNVYIPIAKPLYSKLWAADEYQANAKLICKAPEMYEALGKIAKYRNTEAGQIAIKMIKEVIS